MHEIKRLLLNCRSPPPAIPRVLYLQRCYAPRLVRSHTFAHGNQEWLVLPTVNLLSVAGVRIGSFQTPVCVFLLLQFIFLFINFPFTEILLLYRPLEQCRSR